MLGIEDHGGGIKEDYQPFGKETTICASDLLLGYYYFLFNHVQL
jgi:hypothetical protein